LVQSLGYKVTFLPQNLAHLGGYTHDLEREGIEVITAPFCLSIENFLETRGAEFDAVYITRYYVGREVIDKIRQNAPKTKVLLNTADLHFLRILRSALVKNDPEQMAQAQAMRKDELEVICQSDVVLSYNDVENAVIQSHTDGVVPVVKCPWVVNVPETVPDFAPRSGLSFLGSFNHHPNHEGLQWFAREVMPLVGQRRKSPISLAVYGANMDASVHALRSDVIDTVGYIETVSDAYDRHRIFVAPLLSGAGIKGKVIAALAYGIPCILTPVAAEGVGLRHGHDCLITESPQDWSDAILSLYDDAELWQKISGNARAYVRDRFSFDTGRQLMRAALEAVDLFGSLE
ncbi:MAG: glycosyltransferase, partial [Pseudomonadota bacterium]